MPSSPGAKFRRNIKRFTRATAREIHQLTLRSLKGEFKDFTQDQVDKEFERVMRQATDKFFKDVLE